MITAIVWVICVASMALAQGEEVVYRQASPHAPSILPLDEQGYGAQLPFGHIPADDDFSPTSPSAESEMLLPAAENDSPEPGTTIIYGHAPMEDVSRQPSGGGERQSTIEGQPRPESTTSQAALGDETRQQEKEGETASLSSRPHVDYPKKTAPIFTGTFEPSYARLSAEEPAFDTVRARQLGLDGAGPLPLARNAPIFLVALIVVAIAAAAYITLR